MHDKLAQMARHSKPPCDVVVSFDEFCLFMNANANAMPMISLFACTVTIRRKKIDFSSHHAFYT